MVGEAAINGQDAIDKAMRLLPDVVNDGHSHARDEWTGSDKTNKQGMSSDKGLDSDPIR